MTSDFERLLQLGVPEPPPQPDVDVLLGAARRRTLLRRAAVTTSVAAAVVVAVGVPFALRGAGTSPNRGVGGSPVASATSPVASPTAINPPPQPSATSATSASVSVSGTGTEAIPSDVQEGPAIDWDGPMSDGVTVDPNKVAAITGLAFKPVLPAWSPAPFRAEVTSAATSTAPGRHVVLRYRFTGDADFPSDPRIVVEESVLVGKASDFNGLAVSNVPGVTREPVTLHGAAGLLLRGSRGVELLVAEGNALITVKGPALTAAAAKHLAATFG